MFGITFDPLFFSPPSGPPAPIITGLGRSLLPHTGRVTRTSSLLDVNGTGFQPGDVVSIDGTSVSTTYESPTKLIATAPSHAEGVVNVLVSRAGGVLSNATPLEYAINPALLVLRTHMPVENYNAAANNWAQSASAAPNYSGTRTSPTAADSPETSLRDVNGYSLPEVDSASSGFWCRMGSAAECGFVGGGAHFAWMFTTVVWISRQDLQTITPGSHIGGNRRTLFSDSSSYHGAKFGTNSGDHVVAPFAYNSTIGPMFGPAAKCPLGQAVCVQLGLRFLAGAAYLSVRTSADPVWKDTAVPSGTTFSVGLANYHTGYGGTAAFHLPGAIGDIYGVSNADSTASANDKLWKAIHAKFGVPLP